MQRRSDGARAASRRGSRVWAWALAAALLLGTASAQGNATKLRAAPARGASLADRPPKPTTPPPGLTAERPLRIGLTDNMPLCSLPDALAGREGEITTSEAYAAGVEGYLIDLLPHLLDKANLSSRGIVFVAMHGHKGGGPLPNGSYDGFVGQIHEGRADMLLYSLTLTPERARAISYTLSILDAPGALAVLRSEQLVSGTVFFQSFTPAVWVLAGAALVITVFTLWGIDILTRRARDRAERTLHEHEEGRKLPDPSPASLAEHKRLNRTRRMKFAMESTMIALGQGGPPTTAKSWRSSSTVFSVVLLACYTANLTAHFTVKSLNTPIDSLEDIWYSGRPFGAMRNSAELLFIEKALDPLVASIRPQMRPFDDHDTALAALRSGEIVALVEDSGTVTGFTQERPCDIGMASDTFGSRQSVLALPPNSTLARQLSQAILELEARGIMSELYRKWFTERSECSNGPDISQEGLGLTDMWAVFAMLLGAIAICLVMAGAEIWYYNRMKHKLKPAVRKMKQALSHHHRQGAAVLRAWSSGGSSWRGSKKFRTVTTVEGECEDCGPLGDTGTRDGEGGLDSCPDGRPDGPDKC